VDEIARECFAASWEGMNFLKDAPAERSGMEKWQAAIVSDSTRNLGCLDLACFGSTKPLRLFYGRLDEF
jgi:hypothetical protein